MTLPLHLRVDRDLAGRLGDPGDRRILVGVSGGADSVALLDVLCRLAGRLGLSLGVFHVNYRLRGEDSDEDQLFVEHLAASYGLELHVQALTRDEARELSEGNTQDRARRIRLNWFAALRAAHGYRLLALGHHRADQVETFLDHLFRGAGMDGLKGMSYLSESQLLRPFLSVPRREILSYLESRHIPHREDVSNATTGYKRNWLRHDLMPVVCQRFGDSVEERIARSMEILAADNELLFLLARKELAATVKESGGTQVLDLGRFPKLPLALRRRVMRMFLGRVAAGVQPALRLVDAVIGLAMGAPTGARVSLGNRLEAVRSAGRIVVVPRGSQLSPAGGGEGIPLPIPGVVELPGGAGTLEIREVPPDRRQSGGIRVYAGDMAGIRPPLVVRPATATDAFKPLGMGGHTKRVARLLADRKVPPEDRSRILVVADSGSILWVAGIAVSETTRITPTTERVLEITWLGPLPAR